MSQQEMQEIRVKGKAARIRGATWTHDQVKKLFDVWNQPDIYQGLLNEKKKQDIFKRMAATLATQGVSRSWSECRAKIKNLKADFRKALEKKLSFRYYSEMRKIMNLDQRSGTRSETTTSSPAESLHHHSRSEGEGEEDEGDISTKHSPTDRPGTSSSFLEESELPSTSPSEFITASPHHPQPTSPYQHYQMERGSEEREEFTMSEVDHDSSSRSSMVITHVVSNVIEPVTTVVMPSTSRDQEIASVPVTDQDQISVHAQVDQEILEEQTPIRLEFVVDESENVVLQHSTSSGSHHEQIHSSSYEDQSPPEVTSPSPILKTQLSQTTTPVSPVKAPQPQRTPSKPATPTQRKRRILFPEQKTQKKRKQLETLNQRAVETISNLLKDSSRCLLDELQNAEQRFLLWEEEKRNEERRREEAMFTRLIGAMSKSSSTNLTGFNNENDQQGGRGKDNANFVNDFADMSRKLNGMLTDEVKATEESVRQWELKMQRQESRHTEKLFAMIINAIKRPAEVS